MNGAGPFNNLYKMMKGKYWKSIFGLRVRFILFFFTGVDTVHVTWSFQWRELNRKIGFRSSRKDFTLPTQVKVAPVDMSDYALDFRAEIG